MGLLAAATACVAAALLGGASVAQRRAMPEPAAGTALLPTLVRSRWWWAGTLASLAGLGAQVLALTLGSIIGVQAVMTSSIVWTTLAEWAILRRRPSGRAWSGMALTTVGLLGTLLALSPVPGPATATPSSGAVLALGTAAAVLMIAAVATAHSWGGRAAVVLALATGVGYGVTAVQLKAVGAQLTAGWTAPLGHPALYVALLLGPASVLVSQYALQRGRLVVAVVSLILVVDPLVGLVAGLVWFGERVTLTPAALVAAVASAGVLVTGLVVLQSAPTSVVAPSTPDPASSPSPSPSPSEITATRFVLAGAPVHLVVHDRRGEWRVLGDQRFRRDDERATHWSTLLTLDPSLASLPSMPPGTLAHRPERGGSWVVVDG